MYFGLAEVLSQPKELGLQNVNPQTAKKFKSANCKSEDCHIYGKSANLTNLEVCRLAICLTCLRIILIILYLSAENRGGGGGYKLVTYSIATSKNKNNMHVICTNGRTFCYLQDILYMYLSSRMKNDFF
jgi:hypothetical protein